ncbi:MAG TPA: beta-galactosidase [Herpetosiphonaceae bacterium]
MNSKLKTWNVEHKRFRSLYRLLLLGVLALVACQQPPATDSTGKQAARRTATALKRTATVVTPEAAAATPAPTMPGLSATAMPDSATLSKPDYTGIWGIWGTGASKAGRPWYKGQLVAVGWDEIEPEDNQFDWTALDTLIEQVAQNDLYVMVMVYTGRKNPAWLYQAGVPEVRSNLKGGSSYAYYLHDANGDGDGDDPGEFRFYFKRMIRSVAQHLNQLNTTPGLPSYHKIIGIQGPIGGSGDPHPYTKAGSTTGEGDPWFGEGTPYAIEQPEWHAYQHEMFLFYYQQYAAFTPRIHLLLNTGDSPPMHEWALAHLPGVWVKYGRLGDRYQNNREFGDPDASSGAWLWQPVREFHNGLAYRSRSEMDLTDQGWFTEAPVWNMYWTNLWDLHAGMDMHNIVKADLENPAYAEAFAFFSKYAGYKDPRDSIGVWIALRDGLDMSDTERFPENTYGAEDRGRNRRRYARIAEQFAPHGARQPDLEAGNKTSWEALNDVGWRIYPGNYQMWLYQRDADETSQGLWRVGPLDQPYGRFARRFDAASDRQAMYFDIDDRFFFEQPLNAAYPVAVRVVYLDQGSGTWALRYDARDDPQKTALVVTKTNSGRWREQTIVLSDAYFGNRAPRQSDLVLENPDGEDDTFHLIEITRETGYRTGYFGGLPR